MTELTDERQAQSRALLRAMKSKDLTLKNLAAKVGLSPFIVTAAMFGQMPLPKDAASRAAKMLGVADAEEFLTAIPMRGSLGQAVPTDPTIYRSTRSCRYMARLLRR